MTSASASDTSTLPSAGRAGAYVAAAMEALPRMRHPDGIFCYERVLGDPAPRGRSPRYSLMVLLGVQRAVAHGYATSVAPDALLDTLWERIDDPELAPGDIGLHLWADARAGRRRGDELLARLERLLAARGGLSARPGMEMGWIVCGLAEQTALGVDGAETALRGAVDQLLGPNLAPTGLFNHFGGPGRRRRFPNFATQIYAVQALARVARLGLDDRALPAARRTADRLLALQLPDGGWPWIFDTATGRVVERYEVYSVHQDAMAPMSLLELTEASGDERYGAAAVRGVDWIEGRNELQADMRRVDDGLVLRSIRRKRGFDRGWLMANTAAAVLTRRSRAARGRQLELNPTDRPYHFGWVLEAWAGREAALER
jgi:hypothetical protein